MGKIHVEVTETIGASPETIYKIVSDYTEGHPAILPRKYFADMTIVEGGTGAGTIIDVQMNVMGAKRLFRLVISEPEPGRVLLETDQDSGTVTSFTIDPLDDANQSKVTITTDAVLSSGFKGFMEKLINPPIMRRIYREELQLLSDYVSV